MADFCAQCYVAHGFGDAMANDMRGLAGKGQFAWVICEGCGEVVVDNYGFCQGGSGCSGYPFAKHPSKHDPEDILFFDKEVTNPLRALLLSLAGPFTAIGLLAGYAIWRLF